MQMSPAATIFSQSALNSAQVFGSSVMPALSSAFLARPQPVDAVDVHRRGDPGALRLHHREEFGRDDLVPAFGLGELVDVGGHAGLVPLGDFGALELHRRRRVAGDDVGAELGERVGGVAGDRRLLPFAAGGREHLAELGDGRGVGAVVPLMQHVGLGLSVCCGPKSQRQRGRSGREICVFPHCLSSLGDLPGDGFSSPLGGFGVDFRLRGRCPFLWFSACILPSPRS